MNKSTNKTKVSRSLKPKSLRRKMMLENIKLQRLVNRKLESIKLKIEKSEVIAQMSEPKKLDLTDIKKIGIGALVAGVGAGLTYATEQIPGLNLGEYTPLVVAGWSILCNALRKYIL